MDHDQTRRAFLLSATGVALRVGSAEAFGGTAASASGGYHMLRPRGRSPMSLGASVETGGHR